MAGKTRVANPEVIAFAEKVKLDLGQVQGSGTNGAITHEDAVNAHWDRMRPSMARGCGLDESASWAEIKGATAARLRPRALAAGLSPDASWPDIQRAEQNARAAARLPSGAPTIGVNPRRTEPAYALNPLVDKVRAEAANPPPNSVPLNLPVSSPTLFASGDLPAFTASGISPNELLSVPWQARHALAAAPTTAEAYQIVNACTFGSDGASGEEIASADYGDHPGNAHYSARVRQWQLDSMDESALETAFDSMLNISK